MEFNDFQNKCMLTAIYPAMGHNLPYTVLGLCGESGEVAEKVKKLIRDHDGVLSPERREALQKELGDVLWYVAAVAYECGLTLQQIVDGALDKYADRAARGVLHGEGDNR